MRGVPGKIEQLAEGHEQRCSMWLKQTAGVVLTPCAEVKSEELFRLKPDYRMVTTRVARAEIDTEEMVFALRVGNRAIASESCTAWPAVIEPRELKIACV
jgi:hypothetical protein